MILVFFYPSLNLQTTNNQIWAFWSKTRLGKSISSLVVLLAAGGCYDQWIYCQSPPRPLSHHCTLHILCILHCILHILCILHCTLHILQILQSVMQKKQSCKQWLCNLFPSSGKIFAKFYAVLLRKWVMLQFCAFWWHFLAHCGTSCYLWQFCNFWIFWVLSRIPVIYAVFWVK